MSAMSLSHYNLRADREKMALLKDFYCEFVGLKVGPRAALNSYGFWLYASDQAVLHLSEIRSGEQRQSELKTSFDHVAFNCVDSQAMQEKLQQAGIVYRLAEIPASEGFPTQQQIFFNDPLGNGIELNFV
ncbi:diguanylate cyclase [Undibacterium jejuense]|uniref:Diguanylate cyclase n=1 Tax=Undibacterium jejuense TaxID=1344949 RepID=A0A923KJT9_9BURK|nr:VOC family protein [Undibacterium jejuense]MBC3861060.1 diguanylate cyclase [Undibacterium jejuense]